MSRIIAVVFALMLSTNIFAVTKCAPDGNGGVCCWDVETEGPWKPISC